MLVINVANERSFLSDIFIIVDGQSKIFFLPTYLPIGQIAEFETWKQKNLLI
jgi:hypothetical protein